MLLYSTKMQYVLTLLLGCGTKVTKHPLSVLRIFLIC